jgi:L-aspartate oxidase
VTPDLVELRNLADVAMLIVESARRRKESRGCHYLLDFPMQDDHWLKDTVLHRGDLDEP